MHQTEERIPLEVYATKNPNDEIRMQSSSGGVFTQLAEQTIDAGGVVFGVKWNEHFEAIHAYTETKEGLAEFRGSKYVQSQVRDTFKQAEQFLKQGRQVLFSGVPCQIAGLKKFLRKEYDNLLTVDIICHGNPSPGVFRWYMSEQIQKLRYGAIRQSQHLPLHQIPSIDILAQQNGIQLQQINFRDKSTGWKSYSFTLEYSDKINNKFEKISLSSGDQPFMSGFLHNLYLRPSCHVCPAKCGKSNSDLTLGDYWKISTLYPDLDDNLGVSSICCNTIKGKNVLSGLGLHLYSASYEDLCLKNPSLIHSCKVSPKRSAFFAKQDDSFEKIILRLCRPSWIIRCKIVLKKFLSFYRK